MDNEYTVPTLLIAHEYLNCYLVLSLLAKHFTRLVVSSACSYSVTFMLGLSVVVE